MSELQVMVEAPVTLRIQADNLERIKQTKQPLDSVASWLVEQYAGGGILLKPAQADYVASLAGCKVKTGEDVLRVVENGINRHSASGHLVVSYALDPVFSGGLEEVSRSNGRSVDEIMHEAMSLVMTNQWLYALEVSGGTLHFSREMREELERITGMKMITGDALLRWIQTLVTPDENSPAQKRVSKLRAEVLERAGRKEQVA